jgi:hypothetical protein
MAIRSIFLIAQVFRLSIIASALRVCKKAGPFDLVTAVYGKWNAFWVTEILASLRFRRLRHSHLPPRRLLRYQIQNRGDGRMDSRLLEKMEDLYRGAGSRKS